MTYGYLVQMATIVILKGILNVLSIVVLNLKFECAMTLLMVMFMSNS
ncbi:Uncharacterised protein [Acinetobacter baumannii]|nr:Uncharacterised protein [Acinetobacter baumannii]